MSETVEAPREEISRESRESRARPDPPGFYARFFRQLMAACATPWIILPAYVAVRTFSATASSVVPDGRELWFSIPDLYLSALLILWAAARYGAAAIAPAICLMALKIVSLDTGLTVIAKSDLLHIPILILALKVGLDPRGMAQTSAGTRGTWVDMVGLILIASFWARHQLGDLSFEAYGGGAVLLVLFFLVRPRPLWLFLLLAVLYWLASSAFSLPFGSVDLFGDLEGNMMPFLEDIVWSPFLALGLLWVLRRAAAESVEADLSFLKLKTTRPLFTFWLVVFAFAVFPGALPVPPSVPVFGVDVFVSSQLMPPAVLGLLIIRAGFMAGAMAQNWELGAIGRHVQALLLPAIFAGLFSTSLWMQETTDLQQQIIIEDKGITDTVRDVIDVGWILDLSAADIPFAVFLCAAPVLQIFLLFALAVWASKALVRQGVPLEREWFPRPGEDAGEAGRLTLIFGEKGRNALITVGVMLTAVAVASSFFPL